jgi:hypothetical protein
VIYALPPLPDPPPQAATAVIHWTSFYRTNFTLYIHKSNYRPLHRSPR